jgi:hypothetical protein
MYRAVLAMNVARRRGWRQQNVCRMLARYPLMNVCKSRDRGEIYGELTPRGMRQVARQLAAVGPLNSRSVLYDVGSGYGRFALFLRLSTPCARIVGVEINPCRHRIARARALVVVGCLEFKHKSLVASCHRFPLVPLERWQTWRQAASGQEQVHLLSCTLARRGRAAHGPLVRARATRNNGAQHWHRQRRGAEKMGQMRQWTVVTTRFMVPWMTHSTTASWQRCGRLVTRSTPLSG